MQETIITKPYVGWALDRTSQSNTAAVEGADFTYTKSTAISLWRPGMDGMIAPGELFGAIADTNSWVTTLPVTATVNSQGEAFVINTNATVVQFGVGDDSVDTRNVTAHGAHTGLVGEDILPYKNETDEYVLYSYRDGTDWDIGRWTKTGTAYDDDWASTLATQTGDSGAAARTFNKANPGKLLLGVDGIIYRTNGQYIASHDPTTTTINYGALNLGSGWIASSLATYDKYLAIAAYKATTYITSTSRSESRLYLWDGFSPKPNYIYDIGDYYVSALVNKDSDLYLFTSGRDNTTKIKVFSGGRFVTVNESRQIGAPPTPGSVDVYENKIHWTNSTNGIYALERVGDSFALHMRSSDGGGGMLRNLSQNSIYLGNATAIEKISYSTYYVNADFRTKLETLKPKSTIKFIKIIFSQFSADSSVLLSLFKAYTTIGIGGANDLLNYTISTTTHPEVTTDLYVTIPVVIPDITQFYMNVRFNHATSSVTAAIIKEIRLLSEETGKG